MKAWLSKWLPRLLNRRAWAYGLFWSWNVVFLAFALLGFAPQLLPELVKAVEAGSIPASFLGYAVILILVPTAAVVLGATLLRRAPERLFALGYAVEGPLMLMLLVLFFIVRDPTVAMLFLFVTAGVGLSAFLWQTLDHRIDERGTLLSALRVIGLTLFLFVALYVSLLLAFYAIPLGAAMLQLLWSILTHLDSFFSELGRALGDLFKNVAMIGLAVFGTILFIYTATLLVLMPVAVPVLAVRAWRRALVVLARANKIATYGLATATAVVCLFLFIWANLQPQAYAFNLLRTPPTTPAQAQALEQQRDAIRAGLVNAYLAPLRYISATGEVVHMRYLYENGPLYLPSQTALQVEQAFEFVASPLLYSPVTAPKYDARSQRALTDEPREAADLYQKFFDEPITQGEHATIVNAVRSTWQASQAVSAVQEVDDREVHLARQELTVTPHGDWAEFELHEVYQNQTFGRQEAVYYFSLPESAVMTGLWLGNSDDRNVRFAYRVSPRGAAQQAYRNEVRYNLDPALVEQIGPRQYRLRIFPIGPKRWRPNATGTGADEEAGPPLHMWMTWRAFAQNGVFPLPWLSDKRNVSWDAATVRMMNGEKVANSTAWLSPSVPAAGVTAVAHRYDIGNGESVIARPIAANALPSLLGNRHLAVVVDRSRSMQAHADEVKAVLAALENPAVGQVDVYLTASPYRGQGPARVSLASFNPSDLSYIGGQNADDLLAQFHSLRSDATYDAVFVLTDGSGYSPGKRETKLPITNYPLWMVHLGADFPPGYDDATLEAIQASGGGVTGSVEEALNRMALRTRVASDGWLDVPKGTTVDYYDGYAWFQLPSMDADKLTGTVTSDAAFAPLAARRVILTAMLRERNNLAQLSTLDQLHGLAKEQSIVTPYSSMLVLVNEVQQQRLNDLEGQADRFQREFEGVGTTTPPTLLPVTGVPEPEEWLLLAIGGAMLVWLGKRRMRRAANAR